MLSLLGAKPTVERVLVSDPYFKEIAKFRYKSYCEELNFLDANKYPDKKETDEYDGNSIHIVVKVGKKLAGYARIIFPRNGLLPISEHFKEVDVDTANGCEVSRFIIAENYRKNPKTRRKIFALLVGEIRDVAQENGILSVYAVVEEWLLNSLIKRDYDFKKIGEGKKYMGAETHPIKLVLVR